jgi:acetylornithine/succinyldiaminopimelate/putrescine aminotransferase
VLPMDEQRACRTFSIGRGRRLLLAPRTSEHYLDFCNAHSTSALGHSRPRRASSKSGHVRSALEAEVNSTGYCGLMPLPETLFKLLNWSVLDRALRTQRF